jgi:hypothetical protein
MDNAALIDLTTFGNPEYLIRSLPYPLDPWNAIKLAASQHFYF